jgi:transcriptional regulator with XRE-family HTH domain
MSSQGNRIKELRKCLGLTQEKFAAQIGIKRNSLSQIEIGTNSLSPQNILLICREWNVSEELLREGTGEMFVSADRRQQLHAWADRVLADSPESSATCS